MATGSIALEIGFLIAQRIRWETGLSARRSVGERGHVLSCQQPQIGPPDGIGRGVVAAFHLFHELVGGREDHGLRIICADNDAVSR
jgi:hypothetical protein